MNENILNIVLNTKKKTTSTVLTIKDFQEKYYSIFRYRKLVKAFEIQVRLSLICFKKANVLTFYRIPVPVYGKVLTFEFKHK
jgi:hypothetical protein